MLISEGAPPAARNLLLSALAAADLRLLAPHLHPVGFAAGATMLVPFQPVEHLFFIEEGLASIGDATSAAHAGMETAVVGREGLLGWPALLGASPSGQTATVQGGGCTALAIAAAPLAACCRTSLSLHATLLGFVQTVMLQMADAIASHLGHALDQRIARWLLMRHDRVGGDQLLFRHDDIADGLNVRRASVTDRLHLMEGDQLIRCRRGRVIVRDRARLEAFAGSAYGGAEQHYRLMIAPFGKTVPKPL